MYDERKPILYSCPKDLSTIELYVIHDLHFGNPYFDAPKWGRLKAEILAEPNRYCLFVGDLLENAIPNSKSDVFTQTHTPFEQKDWVAQQFFDLKDRIVAIVPGNHEYNRTTKMCGLYPLYDCALLAGIGAQYRNTFAFVDIGVGAVGRGTDKQKRYVGYIVHKARDNKTFSSADTIDGIDFFVYGHDHDPKDHPRARLVYDCKNKFVSEKSVEVVNSGSFLRYGGYAVNGGYRPVSDKIYKIILDGKRKDIQTLGFYVKESQK